MEYADHYCYPAIFNHNDREIAVIFPDLDVATSGVDDADALKSARELLGLTLWSMEEAEEPIPTPSPVSAVEIEPNEIVSLVDVYMSPIRESKTKN